LLLDLYELEVLPLRKNLSWRAITVRLRRWREIVEMGRMFLKHVVLRRPIDIAGLYSVARDTASIARRRIRGLPPCVTLVVGFGRTGPHRPETQRARAARVPSAPPRARLGCSAANHAQGRSQKRFTQHDSECYDAMAPPAASEPLVRMTAMRLVDTFRRGRVCAPASRMHRRRIPHPESPTRQAPPDSRAWRPRPARPGRSPGSRWPTSP